MSTGKYKLGYWDIRGLAAPIRMAFIAGGIPYEDKLFSVNKDGDRWTTTWKDEYKRMQEQDHAFPNLPFLVMPSGETHVQSGAILRHVARIAKLDGATEEERFRCDEVNEELADLRKECVSASYGDFEHRQPELIQGTFPYGLGVLEAHLTKHNTPYFAGANLTIADLSAYDVLDIANRIAGGGLLTKYPKLQEHFTRIRNLPQLAAYFNSPVASLPLNNKMARFGGEPGPVDF